MSRKIRKRIAEKPKAQARVFAALGDRTRLKLVARLCAGEPCSITRLADDSKLTRQAITKHLRVLERAGIVRSAHAGRERLFEFDPDPQWRARMRRLELIQEKAGVVFPDVVLAADQANA